MTKEHKKMYKAGKNWIAATITVATVAVFGGLATLNAHADSTTQVQKINSSITNQNPTNVTTQGSQINNVNEKQSVNNSKSISQADRYNLTTAGSNNQSSENSNSNLQSSMSNGSQTATATLTHTKNSDGLDPNIYGTVNVSDWDYINNNSMIHITDYHGNDYQHIVVPNLNDFSNAGMNIDGIDGVGITSGVIHNILSKISNSKPDTTFAISRTTGAYNDKVVAENADWAGAFCPHSLEYKDGHYIIKYDHHLPFKLTSVDVSNLDTHNITDMAAMFAKQDHLKVLTGLDSWDTSNVTNMSLMFDNSQNISNVTKNLQSVVDLSKWNTSKVTNMSGMFEWTNLQSVGDLSKWDTSNVTDMGVMFYQAENLQSVGDLSKWDTSKVTNMSGMFEWTNLQSVGDLSKWDTSNVTDMSAMFANTINLQSVGDLSKWDTSRVTDMSNVLFNSKINYFVVSRYNNSFNNILHLIDSNGLMGQPGETIATIKAPTFYKLEPDGNKNASVYDTVFPLVQKKANEEYEKFLNGLTAGMRNIYPTKVSLKWVLDRGQVPTPVDNANATFTYNMKLGTLKDVVLNYVDKTGGVIGNIVGSEILTGTIGSTIPLPKKLSLPSGYQLVNGQDIPTSVTVEKGKLQTIEIYVEKESESPVVQKGSINYVDPDGKVVKTDKISGKVGDKINIKVSLPDGYELANKDEQIPSFITVTEDGIKPITINVRKVPGVQTGSINYVDQYGKVIKTDTISGKVGDKINISLSLPNGYELANNEQIPRYITVTEDGIKPITINVKEINTNLANNEVPYDSTTVFNNVNANYGNLDGYRLTENGQGQAQLIASGWHATGASNSDRYRYMIVFDNTLGREIARQKLVPQVRSDVQRAYPNVDDSLYSGFNITIDIPNSSINHSLSLISRYSSDPNNGEGARVDHWFNSLAFNEGNQANLDRMSSNGNTLTVNGWHATNQAAGRPYHYIIAWDQNLGHEIARQRVTAVSRPDVANAYSTVANAVNSGFNVSFNLTPQFFNDNIQFISRWTDDAAGNGNAVDYWFKPMNRTNRANLDSVTLSNGQVKVAGWHATDLSQLEPNHYLIVFDNTTGQQVASEKVDLQSSQDVKNVFGDIQTANHSRFNYTFDSLHLIPGHNYSLVSRYSADATGNGNNGAHTDSWLNMGTFQQSAYSIDNVVQNNRHLTVQGWLANDYAMTKPYAYAILIQNGQEIGRQRLTLSERDDVAKVYPQIYRSQYSGFNANFDLPTFSTRGLQLVLRFTDDPAGNGNSSDNWINL